MVMRPRPTFTWAVIEDEGVVRFTYPGAQPFEVSIALIHHEPDLGAVLLDLVPDFWINVVVQAAYRLRNEHEDKVQAAIVDLIEELSQT